MTDDESRLLSTGDISRMFDVNRVTVAEWVNSGKLPAIKTLGGHSRFRPSEIVQLLMDGGLPIPDELRSSRPGILIVDDEIAILNTLSRRIESGYPNADVETASNGITALLKIGHAAPEAVILDLVMPKMDGIEVIRRIKAEPRHMRIKILAMSGFVKDEAIVMKAGADAFFPKGTNQKELIDALPEFLPALLEERRARR